MLLFTWTSTYINAHFIAVADLWPRDLILCVIQASEMLASHNNWDSQNTQKTISTSNHITYVQVENGYLPIVVVMACFIQNIIPTTHCLIAMLSLHSLVFCRINLETTSESLWLRCVSKTQRWTSMTLPYGFSGEISSKINLLDHEMYRQAGLFFGFLFLNYWFRQTVF